MDPRGGTWDIAAQASGRDSMPELSVCVSDLFAVEVELRATRTVSLRR